jgi:hypothetical protein
MWAGGQVSLCVINVTWTDCDSLAFILYFFNNFCFASRLVCSFCEAMPGPLSVAIQISRKSSCYADRI